MVSEQKTHIKKGLIIALVLILVDIALQVTHQKFQWWVTYLNIAILLIGVVVSVNIKEAEANDKVIFSNLFGYGFKVSVVTVCVLFIYSILSVYLIFPGYIDDLYNQNIQAAQKIKGYDAATAASNKSMAMKVMRISLLSAVVMFNLAIGISGALVGSLIRLLREKTLSNKNQL